MVYKTNSGYGSIKYIGSNSKLREKLRNFYKGILAGSLAVPLLFNIANASNCDLECNVSKISDRVIVKAEKNPLKIPMPKKDDFKYRHTAVEQTPIGPAIFVYDGYSIKDPKKEKIDFMIKSQLSVGLPEIKATKQKEGNEANLTPFQYMWIDEKGDGRVVIDYDGEINGNEVDVTREYKEMMKQFSGKKKKDFSIVNESREVYV